ncbi:hypothetical protein A2T98_03650 [Nodularia spumigena CENA596]|uniref:Uncharacterized protein n=1 Tax=Nodularia spumigena CENA596 TaxID=1819295 RepID=A0A166KIJ2_NODSP|nr:hypothetical protein [Nodularia spumigena]KZL51180.1 hypothetical protein A2T98_03650 [Nodularia spumigena CENA596]
MLKVQRWYTGFSYRGNPQEMIKQISEQVQRHNLSKSIPLLRVEKNPKPRKPFYFFLAIESHQLGEIPPEVKTSLLQLSFFQVPVPGKNIFSYEQIKSMVGVAHDVYSYTTNIPYKPQVKITADNPFELTPLQCIHHTDWVQPSEESHRLLYWLSTLGSGTWETFRKSCHTLQLEEPKRILRRLRLLGHLETSANGSKWSIAPTTIVKIESEKPEFILCGQRNIKLINQLQASGIIADITYQPRGEAPPCLHLVVDNPDIITNKLPIINAGEASRKLADILPEIKTWRQNLTSLELVPSMQQWKKFNGDSKENKFEVCGTPHETGMYQMCDENLSPRYTLFYNQETNTWHQGDWYGLRFLALQSQGIACHAYCDVDTRKLAIPINQRWPEIYERALVLASGKLPTYQNSWLIYENICEEVGYLLSEKLNVNFNSNYQEELSCA